MTNTTQTQDKRQLGIDHVGDHAQAMVGKLYAYAAVMGRHGFGLGIAVANEDGYNEISATLYIADNYDDAADEADRLNTSLGLSETEAVRIVASSMFKRATYDKEDEE